VSASQTVAEQAAPATPYGTGTTLVRLYGWSMLAIMVGFLLNNFITYWLDFPGISPLFGGSANGEPNAMLSFIQLALYGMLLLLAVGYTLNRNPGLRVDSATISNANKFFIRACFYAVLLVGLTDMIISFLRVEGMLDAVVGEELGGALGRSTFRGTYVHMPLIALSIVIAYLTKELGFIWLSLLVVVAEFLIVIGRFVFSYEQAFMADLVRFWYAALFLFASAYTLLEEGHVRVDVFYAALSPKKKGRVNFFGTLILGIPLCWTILWFGMATNRSVINSPLLVFEVTQAGFGLYIKYLMAVFLGIYAVSMLTQFVSYLMDAYADMRGDPGGRDHEQHAVQ
jgi:TRAP-type mannitol/chloroaromatic compound transport system permease small subunit